MKKSRKQKESKKGTISDQAEFAKSQSKSFCIVGIGASAGGVEALEEFFKNITPDSGMAFVVIQHLAPDHKGMMPEILQRATQMKVIQASDNLEVVPDHVYVIPPNKSMDISNGCLQLSAPVEHKGLRLPIDRFLRSLALDKEENSIGIILSGMGSDGCEGIKVIKEKNGIVLVQDPQSAKFDGMPGSAISTGLVDIIAPASELPSRLIGLLKKIPVISMDDQNEENKSSLQKIIILLQTHTGHDFSSYKKATLYRRIERRMNVHQILKITDYVSYLQENPKELDILFKELLIGVTNFFRDPVMWDKLRDEILPDLLHTLPDGYILRVWVTACSTGEEAYSFAIVFKEAMSKARMTKNISLQIFATDVDEDAIIEARKGVFRTNIISDVSPGRINQFFTKNESTYSISSSIRELVVFATHDLIKEPPFTKLDILLCRNILIYMESDLQKKLISLFYYSLKAGGIMILGGSESVQQNEKLFSPVDNKLKIFKRSVSPVEVGKMDFPSSYFRTDSIAREESTGVKVSMNIQTFVEQQVLHRFSPASILINKDGDILYITGRTGKYLEPATGKANLNIYAMAREGLRHELLIAIGNAKKSYEPVYLRNIKVGTNGGKQYVNITIQSTEKPEEFKDTILIVFTDVDSPELTGSNKSKSGKGKITSYDREREIEYQRCLQELQSTREAMQASQEELKSTNEELQSTNEELQSTNEELTTSKEEMQSLNEELQTVNLELQIKVNDFMQSNSDMKNLLNSTEIATLFLDRELNIRRYTDSITKIIKLRLSDIGRPFTDLVSDLLYPEMVNDAKEVLRSLIFKESDLQTNDKRWYKVRIMPYRTLDERIEGLVVTFIDITLAKTLEADLKESIRILQEHNLYRP
ncbi:MAG TPA: chemotaxis protein CheB [Bacteroidales bacterium]|nr:chemotaxis protein CheB [Bacteroidales bacterium]